MRVTSLASSSSGNAILVEAGPKRRTKLLVDVGLSTRVLTARLQAVGAHPAQLGGVLLTHEHSDHVLGLPTLMKRYAVPAVADPQTYKAVENAMVSGYWRTDSGRLISSSVEIDAEMPGLSTSDSRPTIATNYTIVRGDASESEASVTSETFSFEQSNIDAIAQRHLVLPIGSTRVIGDIEVTSFPTSHDAVAPCGYLLSAGGCRVCVVTDTGEVTPAMLEQIRHADLLILEANHDRDLLLRGPYPQSLKMRILGATGHLSNDQTAEALLRTWRGDSIRWVWLAHLSRTNNTPSLALKSIRNRLQAAGANLAQVHIAVSPPGMGYTWDSTQLWHWSSLWDMEK